ncbi:hypothetical protein GGS26DRAFT_574135 [Hypomontagnella submonticulosa]|nr:hypothetical protein GGS26DRAFT_574135 [Hypomontagnella submonticulosa]
MGETTFAVDPEGDVVLVLRNPSAPFAVISQSLADPEPASTPVSSPSPSRFFKKSKIPKPAPPTPPAQPVFRYLLSSRHLIMASEYFQRLLKGPWKEANSTDADGRRTIQAEDWDPDALLILMYVIHGRNNRVPRSPGLEMLAKVAVLVDYYRCHEAVQVHKYFWYLRLNELVPKIGNGRLILWLLVASVFQWTETLADAKGTALQHFDGRIPTLGLPVIDGIAGT